MITTLSERILLCLKKQGTSRSGLARACGIKPPSVSDWINGRTKHLEGSNLLRAADYFGVSREWLATGNGPMHDDTPAHGLRNITPKPGHSRPLVQRVCDLAEEINDEGLNQLIGAAGILICSHPRIKAKRKSSA